MSMSCLRQTDAGVELSVRVQPRASRNRLVGIQQDELKLALTAPPVDGAANKACRAFLAKHFKLSKSTVRMVGGETSRHKKVLIEGADLKEISASLKQALQT